MTQDNRPIKDGAGDIFTIRMRDISPAGDGTIMRSMILSTPYPNDYTTGGALGGIFQHCGRSGQMASGLAANAPIYSFQWNGSLVAAIRRVTVNAWSATTAFAGGVVMFDAYIARGFTAPDSGGTAANLSGGQSKMRSSMASSLAAIRYASTTAITAGTRTLDSDPIARVVATLPQSGTTTIVATNLINKAMGEHPLTLAAGEGFVINATIPPVGTWQFSVTMEWDEIPGY